MSKRTSFYIVSSVILLFGLISILVRGLQFGIDFKGGTEVALEFSKPIDIAEVRNAVENIGLGNVEVKTFGGSLGILLRTELQQLPPEVIPTVKDKIESLIQKAAPGVEIKLIDSTHTALTYDFPDAQTANLIYDKLFEAGFQTAKASVEPENTAVVVRLGIADWIKENLSEHFADNPFSVLKEDKVGPKIGQELKTDAIIAVMLSLVVILIYLGFRFKFVFALGAVIALFHDVLITLGLFAALYGVFPGLNLEITISVVAAFLTLVGYSINDTVIVFDRVREEIKIHKSLPIIDNINRAINKTLSRTLITVFTTLLTTLVLLIFGGEVLRGFAFALLIGMITGTYSSIFIASAFVLEAVNRSDKKIEF
jgi:preprotein translocase subunit SecF